MMADILGVIYTAQSLLMWYLLNPLGNLWAKFGLAAPISSVLVTDRAKSDYF